MSTHISPRISVKDYLYREARSGEKYEFYDGKISRMPGGTIPHNRICRNILSLLDVTLRNNPKFEVFGSDQKIYIPRYNFYLYPDAIVVAEDPIQSDEEANAIINPVLIIEVLSPTSEQRDRGTKFMEYSSLESLKEYSTIRQEMPSLTTMYRESEGYWLETHTEGIENSVHFKSINVKLTLSDIYRKVF
jgi:Uma2 family endonuclease